MVDRNRQQRPRTYLGGSRIGEPCARKLVYEYTRAPLDAGKDFDGRTLRIFDAGHQFETLSIRWLRAAGFDLRTHRSDGEQFGFVTANGRIRGHIDGVIVDGPDSREVARILDGCQPLAGSIAEIYLQSRGLVDPAAPDLLFHADLTDYDAKRGWPGMVAIVRDGAGMPTGGIHRTFLLEDGSAKAPAGKKMLDTVAGGSVRLATLPEDGHLGIAEGIETALSAQAIFGVPTWAALSADGLRRWQWPDGVALVTIFADAGDAGRQAAATLSDRLNAASIPNRIVGPLHGDDFNDDLRHGVTAADYAVEEPVVPAMAPAPVPATVAEFEAVARGLGKLSVPPDAPSPLRGVTSVALGGVRRNKSG